MKASTIEYLAASQLSPYLRNSRTHSKKQIRQIADSIRQFGFINPLLIDSQNVILAGHGQLAAANILGLEQVPCVRPAGMTAQQKRAYVLADNKLALNAGWDEELLALELQGLMEIDLDFDIGITGFSIAEIDGLIEKFTPEDLGDPEDDRMPAGNGEAPVTRVGEIWELGPHQLICGDSLMASTCEAFMRGERAEMVFNDPPYNVPIDGHAGGLGETTHREFAMASGEMTSDEFTEFLTKAFRNLAHNSIDGSIHFICMDWRHMNEVLKAGEAKYT